MNIAHLLGRVGKDPEQRNTQAGKPVTSFSLATSERYRDKQTGEKQEITTWHNCVCFQEGLGNVISQYVSKGSQLQVSGKISNRSYEKDGITKYVSEIVVQDIELLGGKSDSNPHNLPDRSGSNDAPGITDQGQASRDLEDEIPF